MSTPAEAPLQRSPISTTSQEALEAVWPRVSRLLAAGLRRRGASPSIVEDVVQDVALRIMTHEPAYNDADDLLRWCHTVARNRLVDYHRSGERLVELAADREDGRPSHGELHAEVEARLRLARVLSSIRDLGVDDQQAIAPLLSDALEPPAANRKEATRLAVRRHRARKRLLDIVGPAAAVLGWVQAKRCGRSALRLAPAALAVPLLLAGVAPTLGKALPDASSRPSDTSRADGPGMADPTFETARAGTVPQLATTGPAAPDPVETIPGTPLRQGTGDERRVDVPVLEIAVGTGTRDRRDSRIVCLSGLVVVQDRCVHDDDPLPTGETAASPSQTRSDSTSLRRDTIHNGNGDAVVKDVASQAGADGY